MNRSRTLTLLALLALFPLAPAGGSGPRWGPPRPPVRPIERSMKRLGRAVFDRAIVLDEPAPEVDPETSAFEQRLRLMELQGQLTEEEGGQIRLVDLAGDLTEEQLAALRHHLLTRNRVPEDFDPARFERGRRIFSREEEIANTAVADAAAQRAALARIDSKLLETERGSAKLEELAGRLSAGQLDALDYHVSLRADLPEGFDARRSELGLRVLRGEVAGDVGSPAHTRQQLDRLRTIQKRLPWRVQRRYDITRLAGRLDREQFDALLGFIEWRFWTRVD